MPAKLRYRVHATKLVLGAVILALAVAGLVALSGGQAWAGHVSCGDTITADTTLDSDLIDCPNNGIVIGADDITLDLNGHLIDGDETLSAGCDPDTEFCDTGVANDGHDGVTVIHGSVREFQIGTEVDKARHNRLLGISSSRNQFAGLLLFHSDRSVVRNSSGNSSLEREGGTGIVMFASDHNRIVQSSFRDNGDNGIFVADASHNLINGNLISRNQGPAIFMKANRNEVRRNRVFRNGNGIAIAGNRNLIRANRIDSSRGAAGGFGIPVEKGDHNRIGRNSIRDTQRSAISVGFGLGAGNVVRRNHIRGAGEAGVLVDSRGKHTALRRTVVRKAAEDGVLVKSRAKHTLLRRNHSFGAKDDGIDIDSSTAKLTRNEALRNAELGIEAVRGVIDGGGNTGHGNGDPRQCLNVVCN